MWPDHCVQNTHGGEFHAKCQPIATDIIVDKGTSASVKSYSGFGSPPEVTTLLADLKAKGVTKVYSVGLAYDYCVGMTAVDAAKHGFTSYLLTDATKSVNPASEATMCEKIRQAGVKEITHEQMLNV